MLIADFFSRQNGGRWMIVCSILLLSLSCQKAPEAGVLAVTDQGEIGRTELDAYILSLPEERRSPPADQELSQWRRRMLEELVVNRALEAEATASGLAESPEGRRLRRLQTDPILIAEAKARLVQDRVSFTEEDLLVFYDAHPEDFSSPQQIRVRNIFRRVQRDAASEVWDTAEREMEALLAQIHRGAEFGEMARAHSDSETAPLDGLIGRLDRGQLDPTLEEILWNLEEGGVTDLIRTPVGFHLFKVEKYLSQFKMDFETARTRLTRRLNREATERAQKDSLQELLEASGATYQPERFAGGSPEHLLFSLEYQRITVADLRERLDTIGFLGSHERPVLELLELLVLDRLFLWHAGQQGLSTEEAINDQINGIEKQTILGLARQEHIRRIADSLDDADLKEHYQANSERFQTPQLFRLRILSRNFPEDENAWYAVYEELLEFRDGFRTGKRDFAETAKEFSSDFSSYRGGEVGPLHLEAFGEWAGPKAQKDILKLEVGEISDPILIERYNRIRLTYDRAGYMLVKVLAIEESRIRAFEEVREQVIEHYMERNSKEINQRVRDEVLREADAVILAERL